VGGDYTDFGGVRGTPPGLLATGRREARQLV